MSEAENPPYPAVGQCIYCRSKTYDSANTRKLGDEHIIPESLGGTLVLPRASCGKCEAATCSFEHKMAKGTFGALRYHLNLPTKRPKDRPTSLPIKCSNGMFTRTIHIPVKIAPFELLMFFRRDPEFCSPRKFGTIDKAIGRRFGKELSRHVVNMYKIVWWEPYPCVFDGPGMTLLLAKIGHAYAVAEIGIDNFKPLISEFIISKNADMAAKYIGGSQDELPSSIEMHEMSITKKDIRGNKYWVVSIRLFARLGMPKYYVIVGMVT